jgi:hypothetical protein
MPRTPERHFDCVALQRGRCATRPAVCIGYLHGAGKTGIAQSLSKNRAFIRTHLLKRPEEPVPSQVTDER